MLTEDWHSFSDCLAIFVDEWEVAGQCGGAPGSIKGHIYQNFVCLHVLDFCKGFIGAF